CHRGHRERLALRVGHRAAARREIGGPRRLLVGASGEHRAEPDERRDQRDHHDGALHGPLPPALATAHGLDETITSSTAALLTWAKPPGSSMKLKRTRSSLLRNRLMSKTRGSHE